VTVCRPLTLRIASNYNYYSTFYFGDLVMKSSIIFFIILSSIAFSNASAQLTWSMDNSPYHSYVNNFSVGVKNGNTVMYAAGYANNVLVKSTNGGETWDTVLTILGRDWLTVCCSPNNADIIGNVSQVLLAKK
jgi:hypothetical protein